MMAEKILDFLDNQFDWMAIPGDTDGDPNSFLYRMPDFPDFCVALYQYGGLPPIRNLQKPVLMQRPRLQVLVRDSSIANAWAKSYDIYHFLAEFGGEQELDGVLFHDIYPLAEPAEVGPDSDNRQRISCNYQVIKEPE